MPNEVNPSPVASPPVLSASHVAPLLAARHRGDAATVLSLDLGITQVDVGLTPSGVLLPAGERLGWDAVERVAATRGSKTGERCFAVEPDGTVEAIQIFSERTNRYYSLLATGGAPTMLISGIQMHRTTGMDPLTDTTLKVQSIAPIRGRALDTATGLGYTAIEAAKTAEQVTTIELDPAALTIARLNPWSRALFDNSRISQLTGDSSWEVRTFADVTFSRVIHDPPMFSLAGELYSTEFYEQIARVLVPGGRLFHYIGNPASASGSRTTNGVIRRLRQAGFRRVIPRPEAFGVVADK